MEAGRMETKKSCISLLLSFWRFQHVVGEPLLEGKTPARRAPAKRPRSSVLGGREVPIRSTPAWLFFPNCIPFSNWSTN